MNNICLNCPLKLFNDKTYNIQGIGNPYAGKLILLPSINYKSYQILNNDNCKSKIKQLLNAHISSTGVLESNYYLLPIIRCKIDDSFGLDNVSYSKCIKLLSEDFKKYDFKHIHILGDAVDKFLHKNIAYNLNNVFVSTNGRFYTVNYSPNIKYIDDNKYKLYLTYLNSWLSSSINNDYSNYKIQRL